MVTYTDLFQFALVLISLASLMVAVYTAKKK